MAAVPRFKLKQTPTDVWSTKERLCLASSVMRSGDQNWMSVSRAIRPYGEPNRPADWFSQKNCALQYSDLLEKVETPKRKRGERGEIETPGECIVRKLTLERIEELKKLIIEEQREYYRVKEELEQVISGHADELLKHIWEGVLEKKRFNESKGENHRKWLQEREAAKQAAALDMKNRKLAASCKPVTTKRGASNRQSSGRSDNDPESSSEPAVADSTIPDVIKEEPSSTNEVGNTLTSSSFISSIIASGISSINAAVSMPSPVSSTHHHSPLLNTLLRSSTHVSQSTTLSSPKESMTSPTISSLLSSSAIVTSSSPSVVNLMTTALSGPHEHHDTSPSTARSPVTSPSQGAPTLLKLLDMPLGAPGKLPPLPVFNSIEEVAVIPPSLDKTLPAVNVAENILPVIKTEVEDENLNVVVVNDEESLIESVIDCEQTTSVNEVSNVNECITEERVQIKDVGYESDDVVEIMVSEETFDKVDTPVIIDISEVCTDPTSSEDVYTEEVETEVIEEPSSSTGDVTCTPVENSDENVIEVGEDTPTIEDVVTTTTETVVAVEETILESVENKTDESELIESKDVTEVEEPEIEVVNVEMDTVVQSSTEPNVELVPDNPETVTVENDSQKQINEDSISEPVIDVLDESKEEKESDKGEDSVAQYDSMTADDSESNVSKTEEKTPRRRSRSKKWAMGISERVARRTSNRSFGGQSTPAPVDDAGTSEAKVESSSPEQSSIKKTVKKESAISHKQKRDVGADEEANSEQQVRSRRSNTRRTAEKSENVSGSESKSKFRSRRQAKQERKGSDEEDAVEESKGKEWETLDKVNEDSKEKIEKEENSLVSISEVISNETEEESKEGIVSRSGPPNDSVPNSPASTSFSGDDAESLRDYKVWKKAIMLVWRSVANHKYANVFLNAVTEEMAPGYHSVVYRPMDLNTVKKSIENQTVRTTTEFQRDVLLIFQNAIMYNSSDHDVYKMAVEMQQEVIGYIQDFVATQLMVQSNSLSKSLRRETRDHAHKTRESMEKSLFTIIQENENKRKRPASEGDTGGAQPSKRRRTRAVDE